MNKIETRRYGSIVIRGSTKELDLQENYYNKLLEDFENNLLFGYMNKNINWKQYMEDASRTCVELETPLMNDLHMVVGMSTEVGEIEDAYKKHFAYGKELDTTNVGEEIGDLMWYIANYCKMNNLDLQKILDTNIAKLKARYPEKFTQENALNRDLDTERDILESGS